MRDYYNGDPRQNDTRRTERAENVITFLDKIYAENYFQTEEDRLNFIKNLSSSEFLDLITRLNGLIRDISISERHADGAGIQVGDAGIGHIPPRQQDKEKLIPKLLDNAKLLTDIHDIALLISSTLVALHPFADGNGRTTRLIYELLDKGYDGSDEAQDKIKNLLGDDGRMHEDLNPEDIEHKLWDYVKQDVLKIDPASPLEPSFLQRPNLHTQKLMEESHHQGLGKLFADSKTASIAVYKTLMDKGELKPGYTRIVYYDDVPLRTILETDQIFPDLSSQDIESIVDTYWAIKVKYIETLMDIFVHPKQYKSNEDNKTLKEQMNLKIQEKINIRHDLLNRR